MSEAPNPNPPPGESIEALRRLKATEDELEAQKTSAESAGTERLKSARAEAEQAFRSAKAEAERKATAAIGAARSVVEAEVASLVKAGAAEASKVASGSKVAVAALKQKLIDAVVGSFRSD
jgi:vacuolar-type H+-ATPase subunit H